MAEEKILMDLLNVDNIEVVDAEDLIFEDEGDTANNDADYVPPAQPKKPNKPKVKAVDGKKRIALEVKKYPCVWDKQNKFYRNAVKRDAAWAMVAKQMDTTGKYALYFPSIFRSLFGNFHILFPLFY